MLFESAHGSEEKQKKKRVCRKENKERKMARATTSQADRISHRVWRKKRKEKECHGLYNTNPIPNGNAMTVAIVMAIVNPTQSTRQPRDPNDADGTR